MLLLPRGRRLVFDTIDTALATALCLLLLALLLSVPVGEQNVGDASPSEN